MAPLGVRMYRFNNASLTIFLASVVASMGCGGGYNSSSQGSNQNSNQNGFDLTVYAHSVPSIPVNGTVDVQADGYFGPNHDYRALTDTATWSTSNTSVATVDKGRVSGIGVGSAVITAASGGKNGSITVVVGLTPTMSIVPPATGFSLSAHPQPQFVAQATYSDRTTLDLTLWSTWSSSAKAVLVFPDDPYGLYPGLATLLTTGTATVAATEPSGETGSLDVTVVP